MTNNFTYVKIPANIEAPMEELTADKSGGLEQDELVANAKAYFQQEANADRPSCEILALTIPGAGNDYMAVSLYSSDCSPVSLQANQRATQLVTACGHSLQVPIQGDVFVGRAKDDEVGGEEWQRVDFTLADADPGAAWCRTARSSGGGGGRGGSASSLSGVLQQQLMSNNNTQVVAPTEPPAPMYGKDGADAVPEKWGKWTQTDDEVELKLTIPSTAGKPKIDFKRNRLTIQIQNQTKVEGTLFGRVVPDDCTYTMETVGDGDQKELCVTLTKAEEGMTWSWLTVPLEK